MMGYVEQKGSSISLKTVKFQSAEDQKEILKIKVKDENASCFLFFFLFSQEEDKKEEKSVRKVTELECKSKFAFQCYKSMVGHSVFTLIM